MDRKEFLRTCGGACLGVVGMAALATGCASTGYRARFIQGNNVVTIDRSEFLDTNDTQQRARSFVVVSPDGYKYPIAVYAHQDGTYSALLLRCTHRNCELHPNDTFLECPCHGSEFTSRGIVQNPPAENNLTTYMVSSTKDHVSIQL